MSADALAGWVDYVDRYETDADAVRLNLLLEDASGVIRRYTGQHLSRVENEVSALRVDRGRLVLPQRPADKPSLITDGQTGAPIASAGWFWCVGTVEFGSPSWVANAPACGRFPRSVTVTYSHGYATVPSEVVGIVCAMVRRVIDGPAADAPGVYTEGIDDYRYSLGGGLSSGANALLPEEKTTLDSYRRRVRSAALR